MSVAADGWATSGCIGRRSEPVTGDFVGAWIYDARVGMSEEKKGIRGGDAELRSQVAALLVNLLVGRLSRHLFGRS